MEALLIIGGLVALVILFVRKSAKSDAKREVVEEALESVKKSKKARAASKRKSTTDKLFALAEKRNK